MFSFLLACFPFFFFGVLSQEKKIFFPKACFCMTAPQLCQCSKIISMNREAFDCMLFSSLISCGFWRGFPLSRHLFGKRWPRVSEAHLGPSCVRFSLVPPWSRSQGRRPWHQPACFSGCTFTFSCLVSEVWIEHRMCFCLFVMCFFFLEQLYFFWFLNLQLLYFWFLSASVVGPKWEVEFSKRICS